MVFSSSVFLFQFLPLLLFLYYFAKDRYRNLVLLVASLAFYAWGEPKNIFLMLLSVFVNYWIGILLDKFRKQGKLLLTIAVAYNLGILYIFKYLNFSVDTLNRVTGAALTIPQIALPIGISFFTFQIMSYVIDVYRKEVEVQKNILDLALYISLFPQLIAGPIVRYVDVKNQIAQRGTSWEKFHAGVIRFAIGFSKKVLIADQLSSLVDTVFAGKYPSLWGHWVGILAYTLQIYFDFSGYSDMAIGMGKMFGFDFLENFNYPYISRSIKEFWRRWHISLSTWFRDYLYIPLGGNRVGKIRHCFNLMLTFLVSGLWHGAGINYILWGGIHGFYQIIETISGKNKKGREEKRNPLLNLFSVFLTFMAVCLAWVFFRADSVSHAWRIISLSFHEIGNPYNYFRTAVICLDMSYAYMIYLSIPVLLLTIYDYASLKRDVIAWISSRKPWVRYPVYIFLLLIILLFSEKGVSTEFYYFQF